jgi:hypothetical protein
MAEEGTVPLASMGADVLSQFFPTTPRLFDYFQSALCARYTTHPSNPGDES